VADCCVVDLWFVAATTSEAALIASGVAVWVRRHDNLYAWGSQLMKVIGVDVGGTFTDLIFSDLDTGAMAIHKVPTTP
jgi:Hydantoinase/oxoprolinase N-terminal region